MNVTSESLSTTRRRFTVAVPADKAAALEREVLGQFQREARIPGFRPGKAPVEMLRRRYAKDIAGETESRVRQAAFEAVEKSGESLYSILSVEGPVAGAAEASVVVVADVQPQFDLPAYDGITLTVPPTEVKDADVDDALAAMRRERASYQVVERAAAAGDFVRLDYEGRIDGTPIAEIAPDAKLWGTQKGTWEEAGAKTELGVPCVVAGIVGMAKGDKAEFTQEFPADHQEEALRGKTATYAVEILEVRERVIPELDEALAKALGAESVEALRTQVQGEIARRRHAENADIERTQLTEELLRRVGEFELPESAIQEETERVMAEIMVRNLQRGITREQLDQHKEEIHANASKASVSRLRARFLLLRVAEKESLTVDNNDISQAIYQRAMRTRETPDKIVKELQSDRARLNDFRRGILIEKAYGAVRAKAVVNTVVAGA